MGGVLVSVDMPLKGIVELQFLALALFHFPVMS